MVTAPPDPFPTQSQVGEKWLRIEKICCWVLLIVALSTMTFIRLRLLDFPLERDEGEYAYAGQLILEGVPPYQECYNMKWPGTYVAYAAIMGLFGETSAGIHLGTLFVSLGSAWLVFLIGRRIGGLGMGAVAATMEAFLGMSPATYGLAGHATHFVVLPALAGLLILMAPWRALHWGRCLAAGLLLGIACIMKQQGVIFGLFAATWLVWRGLVEEGLSLRRGSEIWLRLGLLAAGGFLALLVMVTWLAMAGVYGKFWYWTVEYAHAYLGVATLDEVINYLTGSLILLWDHGGWLWVLACPGLFLLWREPALRPWRFFLLVFTLFSAAGVCPGFYFRGHYFLLLLPAASLLCGAAWRCWPSFAERCLRTFSTSRPGLVRIATQAFTGMFLLAAGQSLWASRDVYFQLSPTAACRSIYGANPFPEAVDIAQHIEAGCPPNARIAVFGSEPEIYFYSHRRAATGYIYTYPLMEAQPFAREMQREMGDEIERAAPEYFVFIAIQTSWNRRRGSDPAIFERMSKYCTEHMLADGLIELLPGITVESQWDLNGYTARHRSNCWLSIFKRKPEQSSTAVRIGN